MSAWTCRGLSARSSERSFHLVFESHDGRAYVPIPERSTSLRATSTLPVVDSLNALDPNRPIREADIDGARWNVRFGQRQQRPLNKNTSIFTTSRLLTDNHKLTSSHPCQDRGNWCMMGPYNARVRRP